VVFSQYEVDCYTDFYRVLADEPSVVPVFLACSFTARQDRETATGEGGPTARHKKEHLGFADFNPDSFVVADQDDAASRPTSSGKGTGPGTPRVLPLHAPDAAGHKPAQSPNRRATLVARADGPCLRLDDPLSHYYDCGAVRHSTAVRFLARTRASSQHISQVLEYVRSTVQSDKCRDFVALESWMLVCRLLAMQLELPPAQEASVHTLPDLVARMPKEAGGAPQVPVLDFCVFVGDSLPSVPLIPNFNDKFPEFFDKFSGRSSHSFTVLSVHTPTEVQDQHPSGSAAHTGSRSPSKLEAGRQQQGQGSQTHARRSRDHVVDDSSRKVAGDGANSGVVSALSIARAYVVYKVYSRHLVPWYPFPEQTVERRFSDFVWLDERLRKVFPGIVLPSLPPKRIFNNNDENFVNERMEWLNQYLRYLVRHPLVVQSFELQVMLSAPPASLRAAKSLLASTEQRTGSLSTHAPQNPQATSVSTRPIPGGDTTAHGSPSSSTTSGNAGASASLFSGAAAAFMNLGVKPGTQVLSSLWGEVRRSIPFANGPPPIQTAEDKSFLLLSESRLKRRDHFTTLLERMQTWHDHKRLYAKEVSDTGFSLRQMAECLQTFADKQHGDDADDTASTNSGSEKQPDERQAVMCDVLGRAFHRFFDRRITQLNHEFDGVIQLKFQKGVSDSEAVVVNTRAQSLEHVRECTRKHEQAQRTYQAAYAGSVNAHSSKVSDAEFEVSATKDRMRCAKQRLSMITRHYERDVQRVDRQREEDLIEFMKSFAKGQEAQARDWGTALREVLETLRTTEEEQSASQRRIRKPLPKVVKQRLEQQFNRSTAGEFLLDKSQESVSLESSAAFEAAPVASGLFKSAQGAEDFGQKQSDSLRSSSLYSSSQSESQEASCTSRSTPDSLVQPHMLTSLTLSNSDESHGEDDARLTSPCTSVEQESDVQSIVAKSVDCVEGHFM